MPPLHVAIRADVNQGIGTGHLMRCLTLADELRRRGGKVRFVMRGIPPEFGLMLESRGHEVREVGRRPGSEQKNVGAEAPFFPCSQFEDATDTIAALEDQKWDWLIVDHYALDLKWESSLRDSANQILVIDDLADRAHSCDVLLDQNFYWNPAARYAGLVPQTCRLLLGPRFALLRDEFRQRRPLVRPRTAKLDKILIFFGGVDSENLTASSIDAVAGAGADGICVDVVIGILHPSRAEIEEACATRGFHLHVQTERISELMAGADLSIGAGGTAVWERCCMGLPTFAICTAPNQRQQIEDASAAGLLYAAVSDSGLRVSLQHHLKALCESPGARQSLSRAAMEMVDGRGVLRVAQALGFHDIKIRPACLEDSKNLRTWRNHPSIRSASRNQQPIAPEEHERWFHEVLEDPARFLLIGERTGKPVGVVRFDCERHDAEVSIYLVERCGEPGLGGDLLSAAEHWLIYNRPEVKKIRAQVLGGNDRSVNLFLGQGYEVGSTWFEKCVTK